MLLPISIKYMPVAASYMICPFWMMVCSKYIILRGDIQALSSNKTPVFQTIPRMYIWINQALCTQNFFTLSVTSRRGQLLPDCQEQVLKVNAESFRLPFLACAGRAALSVNFFKATRLSRRNGTENQITDSHRSAACMNR